MRTTTKRGRRHALRVWPPAETDPNIDREVEARLVRKHGRGQTSYYGSLRCGDSLQAVRVTLWPCDTNPTDPGARRHISGLWVKVELVG